MLVIHHRVGTLVEVFNDDEAARAAVRELKAVGFTESQITLVSPDKCPATRTSNDYREWTCDESTACQKTKSLVGREVLTVCDATVANYAEVIGVVMSADRGDTTIVSTSGTLIRLGVSDDAAAHYENEFKAGNTIVTVRAGTRADIASCVLNRFNRSDEIWLQTM